MTPERQCGFVRLARGLGLPEEAGLATQREVWGRTWRRASDARRASLAEGRSSARVGGDGAAWRIMRWEGATAAKEVGAHVRVFS